MPPQLVITTNRSLIEGQNADATKEFDGLLQGGISPDQLVVSTSPTNFGLPTGQHFFDGDDGHCQLVWVNMTDPLTHMRFTMQEEAQRVRVENPESHDWLSETSRLRRYSSTFFWN